MRRLDPARWVPQLLAPIAALGFAAIVVTLLLLVSDNNPGTAFGQMIDYGSQPDSVAAVLDKSTFYYISAIAVAIGFRMGLFNIGVEGQSRLAAMAAGAVGGASALSWAPGPVRMIIIVVVAMLVGAMWASVAGLLKVTRGVSEVISTIMLNAIAGGFTAYFVVEGRLGVRPEGSNTVSTRVLPKDTWLPGIPLVPGTSNDVFGFIVVALALGAAYWFVLGRTRFGFDLRASGMNPAAAVASGVDARRMVVTTMLISGAAAGLVLMPQVMGETHAFTNDLGGVGFTGIAIALLGRNHPIGIALAALLWSFLERSALVLDLEGIPKEIVTIMQGITVLAVVVAYEVASRISRRIQQQRVGAATGEAAVVTPEVPAAVAAKPGVEVAATADTVQGEPASDRQEGSGS
jgi:simple sugar transport system permease protein